MAGDVFFFNYQDTPFLDTSQTGASLNRLNWRCEMLLSRNRQAIEGKRVLDLASHDGRFSAPCFALGARQLTGVEGRQELVEHSFRNLEQVSPGGNYEFICEDVFSYLERLEPGIFDTILCFGFLYHTVKPSTLIELIARQRPEYFILDTTVARESLLISTARKIDRLKHRVGNLVKRRHDFGGSVVSGQLPFLVFRNEDHLNEAQTIDTFDIAGIPSQALVELLLKINDFSFQPIDWHQDHRDWSHLKDYRERTRVSYLARGPQDSMSAAN